MSTFKRLFSYARERRFFMVMALIFSGVATILSFVPFYFLWQMLEIITSKGSIEAIREKSIYIFIFTLIYVFTYFISLICSHVFAFRLETNMKKKGIENLLQASFSFFDVQPSGRTRKIIDDNTGNTHTIVAHILPDSVNAITFPICLIVLSILAGVKISILVIISIIFSFVCFAFMFMGEGMTNLMKEYMEALEEINSETVEFVRGIQVIKVFGLGIKSFEKLHKAILNYSKVVNSQCQMCRTPFVVFQTGMTSFSALVIWIVYSNISENLSKGISLTIFFMSFVGLLMGAFMKIMLFSRNLNEAKEALDKIDDLLLGMNENKLSHGSQKEIKSFDICFNNVTFGYQKDNPIISNFNLDLKGGRRYALVGPSGGGKSTIAKLISGFYPVQEGCILLGGVPLEEYAPDILEKNISFVFQQAKLFQKSIFDNVAIGNPMASYEEVMQALHLAMCDNILDKFKEREKTIIGSNGVHLSGGEIQRIALARAILKDAPIIILDEASAAADPENEFEMQKGFSSLIKNKTVIMIAHRLSSIRAVDEILVIQEGKLLERGTHQELMDKNSYYHHSNALYQEANEWRLIHEN